MGRLTVLKQIASDLASQFGPDCEIVIHDLKTNDCIYRKWSCYRQRDRRWSFQCCI